MQPLRHDGRRQAKARADPETETESDSDSAARGPGHQRRPGVLVLCPGCKKGFTSLKALRCHRNHINRQSTACGLSGRQERRVRLRYEDADDSDWTDPDIRDMMDAGNNHDLPAATGRGEALLSRDRVSVPHTMISRATAVEAPGSHFHVWTKCGFGFGFVCRWFLL